MSTIVETKVKGEDFPNRLVEACGTSEPARIGRMLEVSYQTAKNYLEGRLPAAEVLITIASTTGVSLNWLLTGEGMKFMDARASAGAENTVVHRLEDKWSLRRGNFEMVMRAPAGVDVAMKPEILKVLGETLTELQSRLDNNEPNKTDVQPRGRSKKKRS